MKDLNVRKLATLVFPLLEEGKGNRNLCVSTPFPVFYCADKDYSWAKVPCPFDLPPQTVSI